MKKVLFASAAALAMAMPVTHAEGVASSASATALASFDSFAHDTAEAVTPLAKFNSFVFLEKLGRDALEKFRSDVAKGLFLIIR